MSRSRHSEAEIIAMLKLVDAGRKVEDVAREVSVSTHTIYAWKAKYGGMDVSQAQEAKQLRDENTRLRKLVADLSLDKEALQSVIRAHINPLAGYPPGLFGGQKDNDIGQATFISKDKITFHEYSIDVIRIPLELQGFRTLFNAFHHLPPRELERSCEMPLKDDEPLWAGCKGSGFGASCPFSGPLASTLFGQTNIDSLNVARPHPFANRGTLKRLVYISRGGESVPGAKDRREKP